VKLAYPEDGYPSGLFEQAELCNCTSGNQCSQLGSDDVSCCEWSRSEKDPGRDEGKENCSVAHGDTSQLFNRCAGGFKQLLRWLGILKRQSQLSRQ